MNIQKIQKEENAGKIKLTAVSIGHGAHKKTFFAMLEHNSKGEAILPQRILDYHLNKMNVQRGQTYTVGC